MVLDAHNDMSTLQIESAYDSAVHNMLNDFYIPVLSKSIEYDRTTGFFTSNSLAIAAEGIVGLIRNGGKMRMITSPRLDPKDVDAINNGISNREQLIETTLLSEIIEEESIKNDSIEALGWMISKGLLEIKIALILDKNGKVMSNEEIDSVGIFHKKTGVLKDTNGNKIVFSGSVNETYQGWVRNVEQLDVYCSWMQGVEKHIEFHTMQFEKYWADKIPGIRIIDFPEAVKKEWIQKVPANADELILVREWNKKVRSDKKTLRSYQKEAINSWLNADAKGILNMATGTGKTFVAASAIEELKKKYALEKLITIVAVPFQHLINNPWAETIEETIKFDKIIIASSHNSKWKQELVEAIHNYKFGVIKDLFILTTYNALYSQKLIENMRGRGKDVLLIADEVHNAGAERYMEGLSTDYKYRLGLSATPDRYFDTEGTAAIFDYFGSEVFNFSLERAIKEINPNTGKTFLTPYYYHAIFVRLNGEEMKEYRKKSSQIALLSTKKKRTADEEEKLLEITLARAKIIKNAENKVVALSVLLDGMKSADSLKHCLIYCADGKDDDGTKTLEAVIGLLNEKGINSRRFTAMDNESDRKKIIANFSNGAPDVLVAIKCLDEGVDVPSTKTAIIMASTGNPREYVQRRGRVLRRSPGKEFAVIYDFIVFPNSEKIAPSEQGFELSIIKKEFQRFEEFSSLSLNQSENVQAFQKELIKLGLTMEDLHG